MSSKKDGAQKGGAPGAGFSKTSAGGSSSSSNDFFKASASAASASSTSSASLGEAASNNISQADIKEQLERYAQQAFAKLALEVERMHAEKVVYIEQAQSRVSRNIEHSTNMLKTIQESLDTSTKMVEKSIEAREKLENEISSIKSNAVSALSIFVSFFAFITVSINVFSKAANVASASILVVVFWCLLIGFNILIAMRFKVNGGGRQYWLALLMVVLVSFLSVGLIHWLHPITVDRVIRILV
ncbi:hypothetical protein [Metapseudomonas furukawaii]|uniref:hypothetical protein n=1 Tax=Metapseudomonas furukawaii TaxID=1149133 RepID=UPI00103D9C2D|nr:hypothetical protein [Pseudomonas furukawaii]